MRLDSIGTCVAVLGLGFFLIAATSECDARSPRLQEPPDTDPGGPISVPKMSADGSYIVFPVTGGSSRIFGSRRIFSVYTDGSRLHQIPDGPSAPEYFSRDLTPDISPDGSRIVYSTFRYSTGMPWNRVHSYEIATAKPDGTDAKRLTRNEYRDRAPVWSPDGHHIAFVSSRDDGSSPGVYTSGIYIMNSDGSDVRRIATRGSADIYPKLVWSPDQQYIVFRDFDSLFGGTPDIHFVAVVKADGTGFNRIMESNSRISEPDWSPDGRRLAFLTTEDKSVSLYIADADGGDLQKVVSTSVPKSSQVDQRTVITNAEDPYIHGVSWSSDGTEILFHYSYRQKNFRHSVRPDGSDFRTLHEEIPSGSLLGDGSRLVVYSRSGGRDGQVVLYTTALDGSDKRILVRSAYGELVAENSGWRDDVPTCANGGAVSDPGDDPGLVQDCETLLSIRDILSGEGVELNWQAYTPIEDWWGISIGGSPRRVESLGPIGVELRGTIPPEIGDLTGLKSIWLGGTRLTGAIPPELGNLIFLEMLWLAKNQLSGSIPAELGKLANLKDLHLQFNALTGEIPAELGNLENLQELYLHSNNLSGCIPSTIRLSRPKFSVDAGLEPC